MFVCFLRVKAKILCGKSKHFVKCRANGVLWQVHSPGNSTFALSPVKEEKPTMLLVPEPKNCAMTQAKARQEKHRAAVHGLHQSLLIVVEEGTARGTSATCGEARMFSVESALSH